MKRLYLLAALALSALPCVAFAQACTAISALPATITQPGKYCLAKDFVVNQATGNAISIASNDVTLDCGGRTLKNTATSNTVTSVAISSIGRNNVVVEHCRVIGGWMNGIDVFQDNAQPNKNYYIEVRDNYVAGPWWHGIRAWGSAIEVTNNKVYDVGGRLNQTAYGIRVGGSTVGFRMHVVRGNIVIGTNSPYSHAFGIASEGSMGSAFLDNGVAGTSAPTGKLAYGILVLGAFNRVTDNHITGTDLPNHIGISATDATTSCFDNYLRSPTWTERCDAEMGNY